LHRLFAGGGGGGLGGIDQRLRLRCAGQKPFAGKKDDSQDNAK
jgi:hypothetical protein